MHDKFFALIEENEVEFVDFRFTDPKGKWQHTTMTVSSVDEDILTDGLFFDGSSISGWKSINESDMILQPDLSTAFIDPFSAYPTVIVICDIVEPSTGSGYNRDPRSIAKRAEAYLEYLGVGDAAYFGPELEFFLFDDARFEVGMNGCFAQVDSKESPVNSGNIYEEGNMGHRPKAKGGYFPVAPVDSMNDIRSDMLLTLQDVGIDPMLHHHEVAPAQNELGFKFSTLLETADNVQKYKYVVHNVAHEQGKTATFMPKPVAGDNGNGMHVHQSIWKKGKPLFAGNGYADLSENALYYIGGIIKHSRAINAFTNASTNSYKRLIPGFEAPVLLAYSARNRSASVRIPYTSNPKAKRIEVRYPDCTANPYCAFAAMLMAGLDGIENKIHPGEAMDKNLYDLPAEELKNIPSVAQNFAQALDALDEDRDFLKKGDVFTDDQIDAYIELKKQDIKDLDQTPHPVEFINYYSV